MEVLDKDIYTSIHGKFEALAERFPHRVALTCNDRQLTYRELNSRAHRLAYDLLERLPGEERLIGICCERSVEMVIGILAILKAEGAYVPLDPAYPGGHLSLIIKDTALSLLVTQEKLAGRFPDFNGGIICIDSQPQSSRSLDIESEVTPSNLSHVIYTSGSTGQPKGVMVEHVNVLKLFISTGQLFDFNETDVWALFHSFSFDVFVWELWGALLHGGRGVIVPYRTSRSPEALHSLLCKEAVTFVSQTPQALYQLIRADRGKAHMLSLRYLVIGGEALDFSALEPWFERYGDEVPKLVNQYGVTEATVAASCYRVKRGDTQRKICVIGTPIPGWQCHIMDENGEPVPNGTAGELYIGGSGVTRGYLDRPQLTKERFVQSRDSRLYRTGDRVRLLEEGNIEYIGRIDRQVQLHGFRIEPGEIEGILLGHPAVSEGVVMVREDVPGDKRLVGYVVPSSVRQGRDKQAAHVAQWQSLYDEVYGRPVGESDRTFNIVGWNSSYTGLPIPPEQMQVWLEHTVERIKALQPGSVLEIGGGTGLVMLRIAPRCKKYICTDFSQAAVHYLEELVEASPELRNVRLLCREAINLDDIEPGSVDTVILNSVVQYFPGIHYLERVIEEAVIRVKPGGAVFIGDVRNLKLLELFARSVIRARVGESVDPESLEKRIEQYIANQEELLIAPDFFIYLSHKLPRLSHAKVLLKRGDNRNELTCFRCDVVLYIKEENGSPPVTLEVSWHNWSDDDMTVTRIKALLQGPFPGAVGLRGVPNSRVREEGEDPETFWALGEELGYRVEISWLNSDCTGGYDVIFSRPEIKNPSFRGQGVKGENTAAAVYLRPLEEYANNPVAAKFNRTFISNLREYLQCRLPLHMVPAYLISLNALPLTLNGKVDTDALPAPGSTRLTLDSEYLGPRNFAEQQMIKIWQEVLGIELVGTKDNFFQLGGDSLKVTQVIARAKEVDIHLSFGDFFKKPTILDLLETPRQTHLHTKTYRFKDNNHAVHIKKMDSIDNEAFTVDNAPGDIEAVYPLSPLQEGMLYHYIRDGGGLTYMVHFSLRIEGPLDTDAFQRALHTVFDRHTALRTSFHWEGLKRPVQQVRHRVETPLTIIDRSHLPESEADEELDKIILQQRNRGFQLTEAPLLRFTLVKLKKNIYKLFVCYLHMIISEWEQFIVFDEIFRFYEAYKEGRELQLPAPRPFADFIRFLESQQQASAQTFWRDYLADCRPGRLPIDKKEHSGGASYEEIQLPLGARLSAELRQYARHHGLTLNILLTGAYSVLLSRYYRSDDVMCGLVLSGRNIELPGMENTVGLFINTLPLRVQTPGPALLLPWLNELQGNISRLTNYEHTPLVDIRGWSSISARQELFDTILVFDEEPLDTYLDKRCNSLAIKNLEILYESTNYSLTFAVLKGEHIGIRAIYDRNRYDAENINNLLGHYRTILETMMKNDTRCIGEIGLVAQAERHRLLMRLNNTDSAFPADKCIHHLFEEQAHSTPEAAAVIAGDMAVTYSCLNTAANRLGHYLQRRGAGSGAPVGICLYRSLDVITGLLAILKTGGSYISLNPSYPSERLRFMVEDANITTLITQVELAEKIPSLQAGRVCPSKERAAISGESEDIPVHKAAADDPAYVSYTSGTTGKPKGVCIMHRSVVRLVKGSNYARLDAGEIFLQFAPIAFDASTFEIWGSMLNGAQLTVMPPGMPSLEQLGNVIRRFNVSTLWLTAGLFHALVEERLEDLRGVRQLLAGGDVLSVSHVDKVLQELKGCTLINGYGPTENTTFTCSFAMTGDTPVSGTVPIGKPISNTGVYILDQHLQPVPPGIPGELYITGHGLAHGYINLPDLTERRFIRDPFSSEPGARMYKSGDLVRCNTDGNIEFLGRVDFQVKIRGFRVEPREIEMMLETREDVKATVVVAADSDGGDKHLVAYVVPGQGRDPTTDTLISFLKKKLPVYMIPSYIHILPTLPLTPTGKIHRGALPAPGIPPLNKEYIAPTLKEEKLLARTWCDVLKRDRVGIKDDFFELGGHSLLATRVISRVRDTFDVELDMNSIFEFPTIAELVVEIKQIKSGGSVKTLPLRNVSREGVLPLSFAQQRLWVIDNMRPDSGAYNIPVAFRVEGVLNMQALEAGFQELVERHEVLRTSFPAVEGRPMQKIHAPVMIKADIIDCSGLDSSEQEHSISSYSKKNSLWEFNLAGGQLIRFSVLRLGPESHILFIVMHHIISDGWSMGILFKELGECYEAFCKGEKPELTPLPIQYVDFAVGQRQWFQGDVCERQLQYWKKRLADLTPLQFPTDYSRPVIQTFGGRDLKIHIPLSVTEELEVFSREHGVTLYMILLAIFFALLNRYTGQDDIAVGSPIANRNRKEIEGLIGFFVNTLVMRADVSGNPTFTQLLKQVRKMTLEAFAHQDLPFEKLVEEMHPERYTNQNPLVQVIFALQNAPMSALELPGVEVEFMEYHARATRFDLEFHFWRTAEGLSGLLVYNTDLFEPLTINRIIHHYRTIAGQITQNHNRHIQALPMLTPADRQTVLYDINKTDFASPGGQTIPRLFEERALKTPHAPALCTENQTLTYQTLNQRSNQLAHHLASMGVGPETPVAIYMSRGGEMILALLGILKAGGLYVPLDTSNPVERTEYILEDTGSTLVLVKRDGLPCISLIKTLSLVEQEREISGRSKENPDVKVGAENLCYVTYTSGSTGRAKGVSIVHKGVVRLVKGCNYVTVTRKDALLQFAPLAFDASTFEIWVSLLNGARLVVAPSQQLTPFQLGDLLIKHAVSILWLTAGLFHMMVTENPEGLTGIKQLLAGGDVLAPPAVQRLFQHSKHCTLINGYGPTENTTFTCCYSLRHNTRFGDTIPIGFPVSNTRIYILDEHMEPVPPGVVGELYTGGHGLARGYLNQPWLTAQRFVPDPLNGDDTLYRTGDHVRLRWDGSLEFIGRTDFQVKIRGFRVEPGEIDLALARHSAVKESVTIGKKGVSGENRLISYIVPDQFYQEHDPDLTRQAEQVVEDWESRFEQYIYRQNGSTEEADFNIIGWIDSYTGKPLPRESMQDWLQYRIRQLLELKPERVMELGCGMGLLLMQIAPHTRAYFGTDISQVALDYVSKHTQELPQVKLLKCTADDFSLLQNEVSDLCILNSTIQYFPGIHYLLKVLDNAAVSLIGEGCIFVGDVRNFTLLKQFHASVQLYKADPDCTKEELRGKVEKSLADENELLVAPEFFRVLPSCYQEISRVKIQLQRGSTHNELTRFRYDVFLFFGNCGRVPSEQPRHLDWMRHQLSLEKLCDLLNSSPLQPLHISGVPNARLGDELRTTAWLEGDEHPNTVGQWREHLDQSPSAEDIDPEELWEMGENLGYQVDICWTPGSADGDFDITFRTGEGFSGEAAVNTNSADAESPLPVDWEKYANNPPRRRFEQNMESRLKQHLTGILPSYMVPSDFVFVNRIPLNANGKVDRTALPEVRTLQAPVRTIVAPGNQLESLILDVWKELLHLEEAGIDDNFFDLGGHSLLVIQVCGKLQKLLKRDIPVVEMFRNPTVKAMADYLDKKETEAEDNERTNTESRARNKKKAFRRNKALLKNLRQA